MIELKYVLRANALSCVVFGGIFVLVPATVVNFLSQTNPAPQWLFLALGIGLILNGLHLFWASLRPIHNKILIAYFSLSDFLWVAVSAVLVIAGIWVTNTEGIIATAVVAMMVGFFGFLQFRRLNHL